MSIDGLFSLPDGQRLIILAGTEQRLSSADQSKLGLEAIHPGRSGILDAYATARIDSRGGEPRLTTPSRHLPCRYASASRFLSSHHLDPTPDIWYTSERWIAIDPIGMGMEAMMMVNRSDRELAAVPARGVTVRPEPAQVFRSTSQGVSVPPPHLTSQRSLHDRDESDPDRCAVELVQRGR